MKMMRQEGRQRHENRRKTKIVISIRETRHDPKEVRARWCWICGNQLRHRSPISSRLRLSGGRQTQKHKKKNIFRRVYASFYSSEHESKFSIVTARWSQASILHHLLHFFSPKSRRPSVCASCYFLSNIFSSPFTFRRPCASRAAPRVRQRRENGNFN